MPPTTILPHLLVEWDPYAEADVFVQYNIYRREAGETTYTRIATETTEATTTYRDYKVASRTVYEYAVTVSATIGADTLESDKQDPPVNGGPFCFEFIFLHDVPVPATNFAQVFSLDSSQRRQQDLNVRPVWGRQQPTAFVGEAEFAEFTINGLPQQHTGIQPGDIVWDDLIALQTLQRTTGSVLCLRLGFSGELFFGTLVRVSRRNAQQTNVPAFEFVETFFDEAV